MFEFIQTHIDTAIIVLAIFGMTFWANGKFNDILKHTEDITKELSTETCSNFHSILSLEHVKIYIKNLNIPDYNKQKILKTIDFEKDMIEYDIIKELGKEQYEKMKQGK